MAEEMRFWSPPADASACFGGSKVDPLPHQPKVYGSGSDRHKASDFASNVGKNISRSIANPAFDVRRFAADFMQAVDSDAFTMADFEEAGGASPVYATSVILISSAYAFDLFDRKGVWSGGERQRAIAWGNRLDRNHEKQYRYASPDSLAAMGAARMAWGAATDQQAMFDRGVAEIRRVTDLVSGEPRFEDGLRDNNENVTQVVLAAEVGLRNGLDIYGWDLGGHSLHDVVAAHARAMVENGGKPLREEDTGDTRSILRESGYAAHIAWIPIYLSRFEDAGAAAEVRELHALLRSKRQKMYWGINLGGPTECLWGKV